MTIWCDIFSCFRNQFIVITVAWNWKTEGQHGIHTKELTAKPESITIHTYKSILQWKRQDSERQSSNRISHLDQLHQIENTVVKPELGHCRFVKDNPEEVPEFKLYWKGPSHPRPKQNLGPDGEEIVGHCMGQWSSNGQSWVFVHLVIHLPIDQSCGSIPECAYDTAFVCDILV